MKWDYNNEMSEEIESACKNQPNKWGLKEAYSQTKSSEFLLTHCFDYVIMTTGKWRFSWVLLK